MPADLHYWFDPVCPFAWMTSKWVREVVAQKDYTVEYKLISLRLVNRDVDYDAHFPPEYEAGHNAGLALLRMCAQAREDHGPKALDPLYEALGNRIWETPDADVHREPGRLRALAADALGEAGLPAGLVEALDDTSWDEALQAETDDARSRTGEDVGTPIMQVDPPDGVAFFGPVISRLPSAEDAVALWDHVVGLARFPGFAELKRSMRERPQLAAMGVAQGETGVEEDWHGGSRRRKQDRGRPDD